MLPAQEMSAVNRISALAPLNALALKDGSKELTIQVAEARLALSSDAAFARHALVMVDALMGDGTLPRICLHACALRLLVLMKNVVSRCATSQIQIFVEVGNDLRVAVN